MELVQKSSSDESSCPTPATSLELINQYLQEISANPQEMQLVMQILTSRAQMFENFAGEFLSVAKNADDSAWDRSFVRFMEAEGAAFSRVSKETRRFLDRLDRLVSDEGAALNFENLMLLERARREMWAGQKELYLRSNFSGWLEFLDSGVIYGPLGPMVVETYAILREYLKKGEESEEVIREVTSILDACENALGHINRILGLEKAATPDGMVGLYSGMRPLKQAYNELFIRLKWLTEDQTQVAPLTMLPPFPVDAIAAPPPCLGLGDTKVKSTLIAHLQSVARGSKTSEFKLAKSPSKTRASRYFEAIAKDIAALAPWRVFEFAHESRLHTLLNFHGNELRHSLSPQDIEKSWLSDTILSKPKAKPAPAKQSKKKAQVKKNSEPKRPVVQEEAPKALETKSETQASAPIRRKQIVKDFELLKELFSHDRVINDDGQRCVFRQNLTDGRQITVVLYNVGGAQVGLDLSRFDVTAFKRKKDAFHTISPLLVARSHFGYWVDPNTECDGVHRRFAKKINFKSIKQRALVVPAKIIHSPFCDAGPALSQEGTPGAYVFLCEENTCFHAMFHRLNP